MYLTCQKHIGQYCEVEGRLCIRQCIFYVGLCPIPGACFKP